MGKSFTLQALVLGLGTIKCLTSYPPGGVGLQVMAAKECLSNVLLDAMRIMTPCKGGDDDEGNVHDRDSICSTIDIIIKNLFHC